MKKEWIEEDEVWNKSLLGFFLAVHNSQIKTANLFFKKYEILRLIVYRLIKIYDQSVNPKRSAYSNQYTFKVKHGENLVDSEESSNDVSENSRPGHVSGSD